jgi:hypothetical protein
LTTRRTLLNWFTDLSTSSGLARTFDPRYGGDSTVSPRGE